MKIGSVLRALKCYNEPNLLYEWYRNSNFEYKQLAKAAITVWIDSFKNKLKKINFSKYNRCPEAVIKPTKTLDDILQYFYAIARNIIPPQPRVIGKQIHGTSVFFSFEPSEEHPTIEAQTNKGIDKVTEEVMLSIQIFLPLDKIMEIIISFMNGDNDYQAIERFIAKIESTLSHELTHTFQYFKKTSDNSDVYNLEILDDADEFTHIISFIMYFVQKNELEAAFNECYYEYRNKKRTLPNYHMQSKSKRKNFVDVLIANILDRAGEEEVSQAYENGTISFNKLAKEIMPYDMFLIIWTIFVYGLEQSKFSKLIIKDDIHDIKNRYDLQIISNNMNNLRKFMAQFHNDYILQAFLVDLFGKMSDEDIIPLFVNLFSLTESNNNSIKTLTKAIQIYNM